MNPPSHGKDMLDLLPAVLLLCCCCDLNMSIRDSINQCLLYMITISLVGMALV